MGEGEYPCHPESSLRSRLLGFQFYTGLAMTCTKDILGDGAALPMAGALEPIRRHSGEQWDSGPAGFLRQHQQPAGGSQNPGRIRVLSRLPYIPHAHRRLEDHDAGGGRQGTLPSLMHLLEKSFWNASVPFSKVASLESASVTQHHWSSICGNLSEGAQISK